MPTEREDFAVAGWAVVSSLADVESLPLVEVRCLRSGLWLGEGFAERGVTAVTARSLPMPTERLGEPPNDGEAKAAAPVARTTKSACLILMRWI